MRNEHFQVSRPVGTGHSRANDVKRIRRALHATGYITAPPDPSGHYNAGAIAAIERFQRDHGLKEDGVILPGGPTERVLELSLVARREGGADGQKQLRDLLRNAAEAGLAFLPSGPDDERPGVFVDRDGEFASPERLRELLTPRNDDGTRGDLMKLANAGAVRAVPLVADGIAAISPAVLRLLGRAGAAAAAARAADEYIRARAGDAKALAEIAESRDEATEGLPDQQARLAARRERALQARKVHESVPTILGGSKPPKLPNLVETPADPPGPKDRKVENTPENIEDTSVLPGRKIESAKPEKYVFEALPDDEFWRRIHIVERAGPPWLRLFNHKLRARIFELAHKMEIDSLAPKGGGYGTENPTDEPTDEKYNSEKYLKPNEVLRVPGKPTKNSSYADISVKSEKTAKTLHVNTQTRNKSDVPNKRERWESKKIRLNMESGDIYLEVGKPHPDEDYDEYLKRYDDMIKAALRELNTPR